MGVDSKSVGAFSVVYLFIYLFCSQFLLTLYADFALHDKKQLSGSKKSCTYSQGKCTLK